MTEFATCIIGQGLAGTTLAWTLLREGQSVLIIDRQEKITASRIAAGLITPVTGMRFVKSWRFDEFWPVADEFYQSIEKKTGTHFFKKKESLRLILTEMEKEFFKQKAEKEYPEEVSLPAELFNHEHIDVTNGGFLMNQAARLNVPLYLDVSREYFEKQNCFISAYVDPRNDILVEEDRVIIPSLEIETKKLIFCQGFDAASNPWFEHIRFDAAKGDILTVEIKGLNEERVIHRGIWLAPLGENRYLAGSTYDRDHLDTLPSTYGLTEICSQLQDFLKLPFEVLNHQAAVRPIIVGKKPVIGFHPEWPQIGFFNGLGSKGSLQAPLIAEKLAAAMI